MLLPRSANLKFSIMMFWSSLKRRRVPNRRASRTLTMAATNPTIPSYRKTKYEKQLNPFL